MGATHNLARSNCDLGWIIPRITRQFFASVTSGPFGRVLVSDSLASLAEASFTPLR